MNTLLSPWTIFKFNNNNMVDNMLMDEPSSNGVEAFVIIDSITASCILWSTRISKIVGGFSKGFMSTRFWYSYPCCYKLSNLAKALATIW
jgi:hypothetical protein